MNVANDGGEPTAMKPERGQSELRKAALRILGAGAAGLAVAFLLLTVLFPSSDDPAGSRPAEGQSDSRPRVDPSLVKFAPIPPGTTLEERNAQRLVDLPKIQAALEAHAASAGSYPRNGGVQSVCRFIDLDAGCQLAPLLNPYPVDPAGGDTSYAYQSDGSSYLLAATWEGTSPPPVDFACPESFRRGKPMICLTNGAGPGN